MVILKGLKHGSLYSMHASSVRDNVITIAKLSSTNLWHCKLGYMSQKGMITTRSVRSPMDIK